MSCSWPIPWSRRPWRRSRRRRRRRPSEKEETLARPLQGDEKQRYPWASQINDFVPVGRMRRYVLFVAWAGFALLAVGTITLAVSQAHVHLGLHVAGSASRAETVVKLVSAAMMLGALPFAVYGTVQALRTNARIPLVYSIAGLVPGLLALYLLVIV